ncbi:uncharacterized protein LOC125075340 [Vanessa atalanta]|uniref:uncharacterized protein LOC125075340 n=1 Tax=Vanessa atalanta TaxID=42275 RepID=UPI001FCD4E0F|nr:uncharacterized protein LOC125075340 [Vanessa atalanta]
MAFSFRKMLSNINYFKKSEDNTENVLSDTNLKRRRHTYVSDEPIIINFESTEPDSTSKQCTSSLKLPESVKNFAAKKGSLSDTDLLTLSVEAPLREKRRKCKKLKLDVKKASHSMNHLSEDSFNNVENTPKHVLLECKSSDVFSERFRGFDFNKSFDLIDAISDDQPSSPFVEDIDIESLSEQSDSDVSVHTNKSSIKMCRKVTDSQSSDENQLVPSTSLESFGDVELDKNEEERVQLLLNYQIKLDKIESFLRKLFNDFQFHIEVSKLFYSKSIVTALSGTDGSNISKNSEHLYNKNDRGPSPIGWNIVMEREDDDVKMKLKKQLLSMKSIIEDFVRIYLQSNTESNKLGNYKSITFNTKKHSVSKRQNVSNKKRIKHFDFPDLREAMINLFSMDDVHTNNIDNTSYSDDSDTCKCLCKCHQPSSPSSQTDSGLTTKTSDGSSSITSSIGNFSLDSSTLTAYSESLDQIVSYNSFQDTSLYNTLLQKAAIERITFYVEVHSIQLNCELTDSDIESKNIITFYCPSCKDTHNDENSLLRHILSQTHCEKIHFIYKTAYIKKCMSAGKEIQPSTVLNSMRMYRDENKIVCFGDAVYACSLCFENLIVGESVLMAHCSDPQHVDRREKLEDIVG